MKRLITLVAFIAATAVLASAQELNNFMRGQRAVKSPEVHNDSVTFRLKADYATIVKLSGSWMSETIDMTRGEGNVWAVTIPAPEPEIYTYGFVADGVNVNDPQNVMVQRDGSRYLSMLLIDGERSQNYKAAEKRGTVSHPWYDSGILGINRRLTVYTPYGYEKNTQKKYPVLYLLHGAGGDEEAWISMGRTAQILDNLIAKGLAEPMIVVMPNGNPDQQAAQTYGLPTADLSRTENRNTAYVRSLVEEIVPFIEKNYRAVPKKSHRAIAGLSMGGRHTIMASGMYPGTFDYICPLSMGADRTAELDSQLQGIKKAGYRLYWVACGNTDFLFESANSLDAALTANGLEHTYYVNEGGHVWANWRHYLDTFAPMLFK